MMITVQGLKVIIKRRPFFSTLRLCDRVDISCSTENISVNVPANIDVKTIVSAVQEASVSEGGIKSFPEVLRRWLTGN